MRKNIRFICVLISIFLLFTLVSFGIEGSKNIEIFFRNIKLFVDNKEIQLESEPFIYNDSTYIPLRAVSEILNSTVLWDGERNKISIFSFEDFPEMDYLNGERFVYGEILGIDKDNNTIHIYQHIDDNFIHEEPNLKVSENVVIILQRNDKKINLDFADVRIGDIVGIVINSNNEVRGIIVEA